MTSKTVLITGCSEGGLGDALAKAFHQRGLRVFATARNLAKVQHLRDTGIEVIQLDVTDETSIKQAVEVVRAQTQGKLDVLVNNSGGGYTMPLLDTNLSTAKKVFDVNVFGLVAVTQAFTPLLIASKGTVVNIGSILGHAPVPWNGYYNASKAAVNLLTDQMRLELSHWDIKCILVVAGAIKTKFFQNMPEAPHLPDDSLYAPAKAEVDDSMAMGNIERMGLDVDVVAGQIVANALSASPKKHHWVGAGALNIRMATTIGWSTIWDTILPGLTGLVKVREKMNAASTA